MKFNHFKYRKFTVVAAILAPIILFLFCLLIPRSSAHATNERIITIYADGQEKIVASDAKTVGEVLERAGIAINEYDSVEPTKDTELVAANYSVNIYRARPVTVVDGSNRYRIMTPHTSAKKIAQDAGLEAYDEDIFKLDRINNFVAEQGVGLRLTITRSTPVKAILYDKPVSMRTQAKTVQEFLKEKEITLNAKDKLWPSADTPITANLAIAIYREGSHAVKEESIPFETERIQSSDHEAGYREIKEAGSVGKRFVIYQIEIVDGKQVRKELQSIVITQPKKQVEIVGTKASFSGDFSEALAKLRSCEGSYTSINSRASNPDNWYYGAYQFNLGTWRGYAPDGYKNVTPDQAPPTIQDQAARNLYERRGWQPWPSCSQNLGLQDIYR